MNLRDRGTKKWTSLMLPEHLAALNEMWKEQEYELMPEIDEQQIMENNLLLEDALENELEVSIMYFADHDYKTMSGHLLMIDPLNKIIYLGTNQIEMRYIIEVNIL